MTANALRDFDEVRLMRFQEPENLGEQGRVVGPLPEVGWIDAA